MNLFFDNNIYYDVSQIQKATFLGHLYLKDKTRPFNITFSLNISAVSSKILKNVFDCLIQRHEIFRTTMLMIKGEVKQKVWMFDPSCLKIEIFNLINSQDKNTILSKLLIDSQQINFKPNKKPWLNVKLVLLEVDKSKLLISIPHMISDIQSVDIITKELSRSYKACLSGEEITSNVIQYKDYITEANGILKGEKGEKHRKYWMSLLKDLPSMNLTSECSIINYYQSESYKVIMQKEIEDCCGKLSHKKLSAFYGTVAFLKRSKGSSYYFFIDPRRLSKLKELVEKTNVNLSITLIAAFHLLVFMLTGENDVILGINVSLRDNKRLNEIIGFLLNTVLLRYKIDNSLTQFDFIQFFNMNFIKTMRHKIYPFEKVLSDSDVPLNRIGNLFLNIKNNEHKMSNLAKCEPYLKEELEYPYFDIDCHVDIYQDLIQLHFIYKTEIFTTSMIEFISSKYLELLDNFDMNPKRTIKDFHLS